MAGSFEIIKGDLIKEAHKGRFDVIAHGTNCFCVQGAGIAPQMVKAFETNNFSLECSYSRGDIDKLGRIEYEYFYRREDGSLYADFYNIEEDQPSLVVINAYTQFSYGKSQADVINQPLDYEALTLCMRKINYIFKGKKIGLPWIGCGLAGGDKQKVETILRKELKDCFVTIVEYNK